MEDGPQHTACALLAQDGGKLHRDLLRDMIRGLAEDADELRRRLVEEEDFTLLRRREVAESYFPPAMRRRLLEALQVSETRRLADVRRDVERLADEMI